MHRYAHGTVVCNRELSLLPGYPTTETLGSGLDSVLIEASFNPMGSEDAVLFHFLLPPRFIPRRDLEPLEQPTRPFVYVVNDRVIATYPTQGRRDIRFCISRLQPRESISDYDHEKLLHPDERRAHKVSWEFTLGLVKLKLE
jgi:hypothetical protein